MTASVPTAERCDTPMAPRAASYTTSRDTALALRGSGIPAEASDVLSHLKIELPTAQLGAASRTLAEMRLI